MSTEQSGAPDNQPEVEAAGGERAGQAAKEAKAEEAVLNAAVAFAGHVATAAQRAAEHAGDGVALALRQAMLRQYFLETATLCLRRLSESYELAASDPQQEAVAAMLRDGAARAQAATGDVEALGDLGLDLLERLLE